MTVSNGKSQGFQRLSELNVGFALLQLDSDKVALFSGHYKSENLPDFSVPQLFAPDFFRSEESNWWKFENIDIFEISELEAWAQTRASKAANFSWREPHFSDFSSQVNSIEAAFNSHQLHKAVPTVFATADRQEARHDFIHLLAASVLNRGQRNIYALVLEDQGIIGATPETLFEFKPEMQSLLSMALAGTRASEMQESEPLLSDPKEMHEHNLVLLEIKGKLSSFGEVTNSETYTWDIGSLTHLRTDLSVQMKNKMKPEVLFNYLDKALHPTPALGVVSESLSFTWLKGLPGAKTRHRFGAPFGIWHPDIGARVLVAIRNIQWDKKQWIIGSGCGYVPDSQIEKEWKELELKRASVKALFDFKV